MFSPNGEIVCIEFDGEVGSQVNLNDNVWHFLEVGSISHESKLKPLIPYNGIENMRTKGLHYYWAAIEVLYGDTTFGNNKQLPKVTYCDNNQLNIKLHIKWNLNVHFTFLLLEIWIDS